MEAVIATVVTGVLTFAGSAGLWSWLSNRAERPIKKQEVDNATLTSVREVYGEMLDDLREQAASQGEQIESLNSRVRCQEGKIARLQHVVRVATAWIDDIHERWEWHRLQDSPPPRPHLITGELPEVTKPPKVD